MPPGRSEPSQRSFYRPPGPGQEAARPQRASISLTGDLAAIAGLIQQGNTAAARQAAEAYLAEHPDSGRGEFLLGLTYHREKRYGLARPHFDRAAELEPDYHPVHHFRGWCLYYLGRPEASRRAFERHLSYVPDEGDSHFAVGLIELERDNLDEAERRFRHAIELQQHMPDRASDVSKAHARLADVLIRREQLEEARDHLQIACRMWPEHYAAFYKLSRVLTRLGQQEQASEAFELYRYWQQRVEARRGVPEHDR